MLVLSRKPGESVRIGSDLRICVVSASGKQVKLAIEAPAHLAVHREEVFERIAEANRQAAAAESQSIEGWLEGQTSREES